MKVTECSIIRDYIDMADEGWKQGWHERNGGNLSYRLQNDVVKKIQDEFSPRDWSPIGASVPELKNEYFVVKNEYFVVTGTGRYFRNIARHPEENIGIIELDDKGENYRIVWGYEGGGRPTSELPSHLMNLEVKKGIDPDMRIVYHAHTPALISLSFLMAAGGKKITMSDEDLRAIAKRYDLELDERFLYKK